MQAALQKILRHIYWLYPGSRFFLLLGLASVLSVVGFWYTGVFWVAVAVLVALVAITARDAAVLYRAAEKLTVERHPPQVFSLGDTLGVRVLVTNGGDRDLELTVIDELPVQLQLRDHRLEARVDAGGRVTLTYDLRPTRRGVYAFGRLNVYLSTGPRLLERRLVVEAREEVAVYPSIIQMRQFGRKARATVRDAGRPRPRPVAKSYEFDQIKEYVRGDDLRSVNWKATARRGDLMVNQYEVERAQRVYCIIDKSRNMLMPFNGLSLLDYAINATLAISSVILQREDRAGLLTFSDKLGDVLPADSKPDQLRRIMETLYRQKERQGESDYDLLYYASRRFLTGRGTLFLFTNFESTYALERVLPILRRIARNHLLLVVLFENSEIAEMLEGPTPDLDTVYLKSTARRHLQERQLIAARLRLNGIQVILTRPEDLTASVVDRYLQLKARGQN